MNKKIIFGIEKAVLTACLATFMLGSSAAAETLKVYWGDYAGNIRKANPDGSSIETIYTSIDTVWGLDVDETNQKLYIAKGSGIYRTNLDGTGIESLIAYDFYTDVALDVENNHLYYSLYSGKIGRINLDGSGNVFLVELPAGPGFDEDPPQIKGLELDLIAGKIYFSNQTNGKVQRANLDGSNLEDLINTNGIRQDVAVDTKNGKMYFGNQSVIDRANLDGTETESFRTGLSYAYHLSLDSQDGVLYYTDLDTGVYKINIDGTGAQTLATGNLLTGIALELVASTDTDDDGTPDDSDACPEDANKIEIGVCGCGIADEDLNLNGIIDCLSFDALLEKATEILEGLQADTRYSVLLAKYDELLAISSNFNNPDLDKLMNKLRRVLVRLQYLKTHKRIKGNAKRTKAKAIEHIEQIIAWSNAD